MKALEKKMGLFWYSQTGSSFACAKQAEKFLSLRGCDVTSRSIFQAKKSDLDADIFIFVFPVYDFDVPSFVKDFIKNMPANEKKQAFAIITCAALPVNTAHNLKKLLARKKVALKNFTIVRSVSRTSFIPLRRFLPLKSPGPFSDGDALKKVNAFMEKGFIKGKTRRPLYNPINPLHWVGVATPANGPRLFLGARSFDQGTCTDCGFCLAMCPSGAIRQTGQGFSYDKKLCTGCCGCLNICPTNSWKDSWHGPELFYKGAQIKEMVKARRG